jgi:hypothetical protein
MSTPLIILVAFLGLLAIVGPPMWWYSHGKRPGEKREKKWGAILLGFLVLMSIGYVQPTVKGDWIGWSVNMARILSGVWLIAFGAKGSRIG